jgi:hypothetical protein
MDKVNELVDKVNQLEEKLRKSKARGFSEDNGPGEIGWNGGEFYK